MCAQEWQCVCVWVSGRARRARRASGSVCQFSEVMNESGCVKNRWPLHSDHIPTYIHTYWRSKWRVIIGPGNVSPVLLDYSLGADSRKGVTLKYTRAAVNSCIVIDCKMCTLRDTIRPIIKRSPRMTEKQCHIFFKPFSEQRATGWLSFRCGCHSMTCKHRPKLHHHAHSTDILLLINILYRSLTFPPAKILPEGSFSGGPT